MGLTWLKLGSSDWLPVNLVCNEGMQLLAVRIASSGCYVTL